MRRRVKITGLGPVTPAGTGTDIFFKGICESVSRVREISRLKMENGASCVGAEVLDFDPKKYSPLITSRRVSRYTQFAVAGTVLALRDAGLTVQEIQQFAPVIVTGTCTTDFEKLGRTMEATSTKGPRYAHATMPYDALSFTVAGKIAEYLEIQARMYSVQTACCSGLDAIGQAADLIATGQSDLAIAGGTEAPLTQCPIFEMTVADLSPTTDGDPGKCCRPFDLWRTTGVVGEGATILILEPESSPRPAYAWISGYGNANDGAGLPGEGICDAVTSALANARLKPSAVDFVNAWGPGHRAIDANECNALRTVFGHRLADIAAVSIKGAIGTAFAASGPIQVASAALTLSRGIVPPTVNWETPDPNCPLNLSATSRRLHPSVAVINAHGMAGGNAAVIIEREC